jgi:spore maturation protein SpmA
MNIAEKAGAINWLARKLNPFMKRLFPEVPNGHPVMGEMVMNFSANMLGLDNAATPFGLKAMKSLEEINSNKALPQCTNNVFGFTHQRACIDTAFYIYLQDLCWLKRCYQCFYSLCLGT